jgi:hypothetical protein
MLKSSANKAAIYRCCLAVFLLLGLFLEPLMGLARSPTGTPADIAPFSDKIPLHLMLSPEKEEPGLIDVGPVSYLHFSLNWTQCQIHISGYYDPILISLPGAISYNSPIIWNLRAASTQIGGSPLLYFTEDIFGHTGPSYGANIPLTWEISLDGGQFTPMILLPDNTLQTTFPPGPHTFQVRITGTPQPFQADGYYHLQLSQCLIPQL